MKSHIALYKFADDIPALELYFHFPDTVSDDEIEDLVKGVVDAVDDVFRGCGLGPRDFLDALSEVKGILDE